MYLAGSNARKLGGGGSTSKDREGAGLGGSSSDTGQLAEGGTGSEAHYSRSMYSTGGEGGEGGEDSREGED